MLVVASSFFLVNELKVTINIAVEVDYHKMLFDVLSFKLPIQFLCAVRVNLMLLKKHIILL